MSETVAELYATIRERKANPPLDSYTAKLFAAGDVELTKKVGEEAVEAIVAYFKESETRLASEAADLMYHLLVLLAARGVDWSAVESELERRRK